MIMSEIADWIVIIQTPLFLAFSRKTISELTRHIVSKESE